jgi:uncharacterized protein YdeI (YjbR/CyaY-like superfamily)
MRPRFFSTPSALREWLEAHHATTKELLVGFHKRLGEAQHHLARAVDEALSFGWIDGVRRSLDDVSYTIRFTPRTARAAHGAPRTSSVPRS